MAEQKDIIIDSAISFSEAIEGTTAPEQIVDSLVRSRHLAIWESLTSRACVQF